MTVHGTAAIAAVCVGGLNVEHGLQETEAFLGLRSQPGTSLVHLIGVFIQPAKH